MNELKIEELETRIAPSLTMTITPSAGESGAIEVPTALPADAAHADGADGVAVA